MTSINIEELQVKKEELESTIKEAKTQMAAIDYVLATFTDQKVQASLPIPEEPLYLKEGILKVLAEKGRVVSTQQIRKELKKLEVKHTDNTLLSRLSTLAKEGEIKRVGMGKYKIS